MNNLDYLVPLRRMQLEYRDMLTYLAEKGVLPATTLAQEIGFLRFNLDLRDIYKKPFLNPRSPSSYSCKLIDDHELASVHGLWILLRDFTGLFHRLLLHFFDRLVRRPFRFYNRFGV